MTADRAPAARLTARRAQDLAKLARLNEALARRDVEPLFTPEVTELLSNHALHRAVRLTEDELVRATRKLAEQ